MEKKQKFLIEFAFYAVILALAFLVLKYGGKYFMPFIIGFIVALLLDPVVKWFMRITKLNRKASSMIIVSLVIIIIALLILLLGIKLVESSKLLFTALPLFYENKIEPYIQELLSWYENTDFIDELGPTVGNLLDTTASSILSSLGDLVTTISVKAVTLLTNLVSSFPSFLINFLITVISIYFISNDFENIVIFIRKQFKEKTVEFVQYLKVNFFDTIGKYLLSYGSIMLITFGETSVLMLVAGIESPILIAFLIALFDFMPIVGISTIFIPWIVLDIVAKNYVRAIIIAIGWLAMTVIRNIIEPKIVGTKVGLHPVVALIAMFVGLRLYGIIGMFGIPISIVMLNEMQKADIIHWYKE